MRRRWRRGEVGKGVDTLGVAVRWGWAEKGQGVEEVHEYEAKD